MDVDLTRIAAFMIKQLKATITDELLFNLAEDAFAKREWIKTKLRMEAALPSELETFLSVLASVLGLTVPALSGCPVIILKRAIEAANSDVVAVIPCSDDSIFFLAREQKYLKRSLKR